MNRSETPATTVVMPAAVHAVSQSEQHKYASLGSLNINGKTVLKAGHHWADWLASMGLLAMICFTTAINFYYQLMCDNVVTSTFPDLYSTDKEWLFGADHTAPLNDSLIYTFIESSNAADITHLKRALLGSPPAPFNTTTPCVVLVGHDEGSLNGICDHFDRAQVPEWARSFDALLIQTIYLATVEQHRLGQKATPYIGFFQGFRNARDGWYQQETIERLYCTTQSLAGVKTDKPERILYTKAHTVLRSVDCSLHSEASSPGCQVIKNVEPVALFPDGSGTLRAYEVVREENGNELILGPFAGKWTIGAHTDVWSVWPLDDCLYIRKGSIGWLGAGYQTYTPRIPALALAAKVQLIIVLFVVWLIEFRCAIHRIHYALFTMSRLGLSHFLVLQMVWSAYHEQDILRTIYSWKRDSTGEWILLVYVLSSSALTCALVALSLVRVVMGASIFSPSCWVAIALPVPVVLLELQIAHIHYSAYTMANGLLPIPVNCAPGIDACALGKTNYQIFTSLLTLLPVLIEYRRRQIFLRKCRPLHITIQSAWGDNDTERPRLTSFEFNCLDKHSIHELVHDMDVQYTWIRGVPHVSALAVSACGFTIIKQRFLIRTKDLVLLLLATLLPQVLLRDASVIIWPLAVNANGRMQVEPARRVFLSFIKYVQVDSTGPSRSLLQSDNHLLA